MRRSVLKFAYRVLGPQPDTGHDSGSNGAEALCLLAEGETTHVVVDRDMRKTVLPEKYLAALKQFLAGPADA